MKRRLNDGQGVVKYSFLLQLNEIALESNQTSGFVAMREMILKAVANPPKILWGPFLPTLLNLGIQFPLMFMCMGVFKMNPLIFIVTIVAAHGVIVLRGGKEPHISSMIQAFGQCRRISNNLYKEKGNKFAP